MVALVTSTVPEGLVAVSEIRPTIRPVLPAEADLNAMMIPMEVVGMPTALVALGLAQIPTPGGLITIPT